MVIGRVVFFCVSLCLFLGMLLLFAGPGETSCRLRCLNQKFALLRASHLNERLEAVERRLSARDALIAQLEARTRREEEALANFRSCFGEVPITRYGEDFGPSGYVFNLQRAEGPETFFTTALDASYPKDPVGVWLWVNSCNAERITPKSSLLPTP